MNYQPHDLLRDTNVWESLLDFRNKISVGGKRTGANEVEGLGGRPGVHTPRLKAETRQKGNSSLLHKKSDRSRKDNGRCTADHSE